MAEEKDILLNFKIDTEDSVQSIEKLRAQNRLLTQERNRTNIATEEGRKRVQELNAALDKNNQTIKQNSDALQKQRLNVGNYTDSIEEAAKNVNIAGTNIEGLTTRLSAFANPATAAVGIVTALGAAYLKSGRGAEALEEQTFRAEAAVEAFSEAVADFIELSNKSNFEVEGLSDGIATFFSKLLTSVPKGLGTLSKAFETETSKAIAAQKILLDDLEREATAQSQKTVSLRSQIDILKTKRFEEKLTTEENIAALEEIQKKEKELNDVEIGLAKQRRDAIEEITRLKGGEKNLSDEQFKVLVDSRNEVTLLESAYSKSTRKITKELTALNELLNKVDKSTKKITKSAEGDDTADSEFQRRKRLRDLEQSRQEPKDFTAPLKEGLKIEKNIAKERLDTELDLIAKRQRAQEKAREDYIANEQLKLAATQMILSQASSLFDESSAAGKILASAQATINTYQGATLALATFPPPFSYIAAATTITTGLAQVAKINGAGFAEGGYTGNGGKYEPAGIVHKGEWVAPKEMVQSPAFRPIIANLEAKRKGLKGYADGGLVTNTSVAPTNTNLLLSNAIKRLPAPEVSVKEVTKVQNRVRVKQTISRR